jgi:hypothetical protein
VSFAYIRGSVPAGEHQARVRAGRQFADVWLLGGCPDAAEQDRHQVTRIGTGIGDMGISWSLTALLATTPQDWRALGSFVSKRF